MIPVLNICNKTVNYDADHILKLAQTHLRSFYLSMLMMNERIKNITIASKDQMVEVLPQ